jgi:hypothetical protein
MFTIRQLLLAVALPICVRSQELRQELQIDRVVQGSAICTFRVVDSFGNAIDDFRLTLRRADGRNDSVKWRDNSLLPYGTYQVTISRSGFRDFQGTLVANQPRQNFVVCLQFKMMTDFAAEVVNPTYGKLIGAEGVTNAYNALLVFPVFCSTGSVSTLHAVYKSGFGFDHLDPGLYTFVFLRDTTPVLTTTVRVPYKPRQRLEIRVPPEVGLP